MADSDLVIRYRKQLQDSFAPLIPTDRPIVLVGYPDGANCGDHAIWLGEKKLLGEFGLSPAYECSAQNYDKESMRAALRDGTILMHGGGSFGDRHTAYHEFRLKVLDDFPSNKVIVFPHHVTFLDSDYLQRTSALIAKHPDVTLFARSFTAQHLFARHLGSSARIELAPDMTFMLGEQKRPAEASYEVVWISRTDQTRANDQTEVAARLSSQAAEKYLLPQFGDGIEMNFVVKQRPPTVLLTDWHSLFLENETARTEIKKLSFDARSQAYFARAIYMLSQGQIIITDRLLGHVLCLLLSIPHVFLNDETGKNWNFHETWTKDSTLCRLARNPAEAWMLARNAVAKIKDSGKPEPWSWRTISPA